jgi:hypothetical protein
MGCPYKFVLGIPKQGFHSSRFMGLAFNDVIGTVGLALITAFILKVSFWKSLLVWFLAGEILHYAFGVQTEFLTLIGIQACS